jgi:hypothetical protein
MNKLRTVTYCKILNSWFPEKTIFSLPTMRLLAPRKDKFLGFQKKTIFSSPAMRLLACQKYKILVFQKTTIFSSPAMRLLASQKGFLCFVVARFMLRYQRWNTEHILDCNLLPCGGFLDTEHFPRPLLYQFLFYILKSCTGHKYTMNFVWQTFELLMCEAGLLPWFLHDISYKVTH